MILDRKKKYLHIALNSDLSTAYSVINQLPQSDRILLEAGTPMIKQYGVEAIRSIYSAWQNRLYGEDINPYIIADLKTMDRASTEVMLAKQAGASAAICLGQASVETINAFIDACKADGMDSMLDMMNIEYPLKILRQLKSLPDVVLLHRGVDEETFNKDKPIPYIQINKVLGSYNVLVSIAGGDTIREVQRAIFNGASIVAVWKEFYQASGGTADLAQQFLDEVK